MIIDVETGINKIKVCGREEHLKVFDVYKQLYARIAGLSEIDMTDEGLYVYYKSYIKYELQAKITLELLKMGDIFPCYNSYRMVTRELRMWSEFLKAMQKRLNKL